MLLFCWPFCIALCQVATYLHKIRRLKYMRTNNICAKSQLVCSSHELGICLSIWLLSYWANICKNRLLKPFLTRHHYNLPYVGTWKLCRCNDKHDRNLMCATIHFGHPFPTTQTADVVTTLYRCYVNVCTFSEQNPSQIYLWLLFNLPWSLHPFSSIACHFPRRNAITTFTVAHEESENIKQQGIETIVFSLFLLNVRMQNDRNMPLQLIFIRNMHLLLLLLLLLKKSCIIKIV